MMYDHKPAIPFGKLDEVNLDDLHGAEGCEIGVYDDHPCYLIDLDANRKENPLSDGPGEFYSIRRLLAADEQLFMLAGRAWQVAHFLRTHKFCGQCGNKMSLIDYELATICKSCGHRCYQRISPCIIVAIRKDKKILLARGPRHREGFYSVLAGFVESGETLEQAVEREVMEEVGVKVKNVRYVGSQPWPFPHSLMMGFTAEHADNDILIDGEEIVEAGWFDYDNLPEVPPASTLSGRLISASKKLSRA